MQFKSFQSFTDTIKELRPTEKVSSLEEAKAAGTQLVKNIEFVEESSPGWAKSGRAFHRVDDIRKELTPGFYVATMTMSGPILIPFQVTNDDILDLPGEKTEAIIKAIDDFYSIEENFAAFNFVHKRGVMLKGQPGCHAAGTKILMYDGTLKNVEDVCIGDKLMGPDSTVRNVLALASGRQEMIKVTPIKGESFIVNKDHLFSLQYSGKQFGYKIANITIKEFENLSTFKQGKLKLRRPEKVEFNNNSELLVDPYILGLWLGDGTSRTTALTTMDEVLKNTWIAYATKIGMQTRVERKENNKAETIIITSGKQGGTDYDRNILLNYLKVYNLLQNKHIPQNYLTTSIENRLQLLAGLIDTDGHYDEKNNGFEYSTVIETLADQVVFLCRSLGFYAKKVLKNTSYTLNGEKCFSETYRIHISGELDSIPVRLERKKAFPRKQIKSVLRTGFTYEYLPEDNYYGFSLDNDHLYLTSDFIVHHNTGKSIVAFKAGRNLIQKHAGVVIYATDPYSMELNARDIREVQPFVKILNTIEDIDMMVSCYGERKLTAFLDGESSIGGLLTLGITNDDRVMSSRLMARPSRFDVIETVGVMSAEARKSFLEQKAITLSTEQIDLWVEKTEDYTVPMLKELMILVLAYCYPLEPSVEKINKTFKSKVVDV